MLTPFAIGVAFQVLPAGELGDLFAQQPLFVKTVAQAFLRGGGFMQQVWNVARASETGLRT